MASIILSRLSNHPIARSNHSCVLFEDFLYVFGGENTESQLLNDVWKFDVNNNTWVQIQCGGYIEPRTGHSAVVYEKFMIVFGGDCGKLGRSNEIFMLDLMLFEWSRVDCRGMMPAARLCHTASVLNGAMYIYSGYDWENYFSDLWKFDFETKVWTQVVVMNPLVRVRASAIVILEQSKILVFGGEDENMFLQNTSFFLDINPNGDTSTIISIDTQGEVPPDMYGHASVLLKLFDKSWMIVLGGYAGEMNLLNDVYCLDIENRLWYRAKSIQKFEGRDGCSAVVCYSSVFMYGGRNIDMVKLNDFNTFTVSVDETSQYSQSLSEWSCSVCTFINNPNASICSICESRK